MKRVLQITAILSLFASMLLTSCVSTKKFAASEAQADKFQNDFVKASNQLNECNAQVEKLNMEKTVLQNEKGQLQDANSESASNLKDLTKEANTTIAEQAKRLSNFQESIQAQKKVLNELKNLIADALINYDTDELSIDVKNGKVYVYLEEKLLFKSGSAIVDVKGKEVLKTLAKILNTSSDITVMIEGHTDNQSIQTELFKDNWDLSAARAISILRVLTINNGFDPYRITASGMGEYHPIETNETAEGRANNRRTEIILSPDLDELFNVLFN